MPFAPPQPEPGIRLSERYIPKVEQVETVNYRIWREGFLHEWTRKRSNSAFLTVKYGLIDAEETLNKISCLEADWDSYGAPAPSPAAILASKAILDSLAVGLILPSAIVPSASGGVSIYFMRGDRTAYVESYNDGTQALVFYSPESAPEVLEIGSEILAGDVNARITSYLDQR
jgi:hypothetical protein